VGFVAQWIAAEEMLAGRDVVCIDYEDDEEGVTTRLIDLGLEPDTIAERFHYKRPEERYALEASVKMRDLVERCRPRLVIIDSVGEAHAVDGVKGNDDDDVARWFRRYPRSIAGLGPAVVVIDHVPKAKDRPAGYAIGSQRKRAAITGAAFMVEPIRALGRGQVGAAKLTCAKDRNGVHVRDRIAATFTMDATSAQIVAVLTAPEPSRDAAGAFRPTVLMEKLSRYLEGQPDDYEASKNVLLEAVPGNTDAKRTAIDRLVGEGHLARRQDGQRSLHRLVRPFRGEE
jgi:hypothetical protein